MTSKKELIFKPEAAPFLSSHAWTLCMTSATVVPFCFLLLHCVTCVAFTATVWWTSKIQDVRFTFGWKPDLWDSSFPESHLHSFGHQTDHQKMQVLSNSWYDIHNFVITQLHNDTQLTCFLHLIWSSDSKKKLLQHHPVLLASNFIRLFKMQIAVHENHKLISGCYRTSLVWSGSVRQRHNSEPHSSSLSIFDSEGMKGTKALSRNRSGHFEESSSYLSLSKVVSRRALRNQKQHEQADETLNSAGTLSRDEGKKTLLLLKTWRLASFSAGRVAFRRSAGSASCYSQCKKKKKQWGEWKGTENSRNYGNEPSAAHV